MYPDTALVVAILAAFVAGLVRGFSGFGSALVFMPVASAAFSPALAAPTLLVVDFTLTLPLVFHAVRHCGWRTVIPAAVGAFAAAPLGAMVLRYGDPLMLRWAITAVVVVLLALLASGWRYHGEPRIAASLGAGGASGFLNGFGQVGGPPLIAFWISGPFAPLEIRANMLVFFALSSLSSFAAYFWNGLFTAEVGRLVLFIAPAFAVALFAGGRLFQRSGAGTYRRIAYIIIGVAAFASMPLFDSILR